MGPTHALTGVVAALATAPLLEGPLQWERPESVLYVVAAAGAAMLPDLDQRGSSVARTYGPVTNVLARMVGALMGGHRQGTHSVLGGAVLAGACSALAGQAQTTAAIVLWIVLGVAARTVGLVVPAHRVLTSLVHAVVTGGVDLTTVVPAVVVCGWVAHVAGDALTPGGVPLAWPVSRWRLSVPLVRTDGRREALIVVPALVVLLVALVWTTTSAGIWLSALAAGVTPGA